MLSIYPSLIAANQLNLENAVLSLEPFCQGFHCDVMDNHFVPNLTWGPPTVNALAALAFKPLWVHLMVENPQAMLEKLVLKPSSIVSFHLESKTDVKSTIACIRQKGWRPSLAINPNTPLEQAFASLHMVDQVLIMSVEPGASGQAFIQESCAKIARLAIARAAQNWSFTIGVDGGITQENIASVCQAGGEDLVAGAALFGKPDPLGELAKLYESSQIVAIIDTI